jgi:hypothetical protein
MTKDKYIKNDLTATSSGSKTELTDFDICELFIKCTEVFAQTASRLEMERGAAVTLGKELWKETIKTLKEYRDGQS